MLTDRWQNMVENVGLAGALRVVLGAAYVFVTVILYSVIAGNVWRLVVYGAGAITGILFGRAGVQEPLRFAKSLDLAAVGVIVSGVLLNVPWLPKPATLVLFYLLTSTYSVASVVFFSHPLPRLHE